MSTAVLSREEELYWLALKLVPGLGTRTSNKLLDRFRSPQAIFRASRTELEGAGVSGAVAQSIASGCTFDDAAAQQEKMLEAGAVLVTSSDSRYPQPLREIFDPPILLFARGRVELMHSFMLGVVGTRRPTPYGLAVAERLSGDLAHAGLAIVSGMARGIDSAAHKGTLAAGGDTIAVLGCGVDVIYPSENKKLAAEIVAKGLIISEFPMASVGFPQNFPIRNRIISGMSMGVLVVEGAQYSGSLITARLAMEFGREVYGVPGNATQPSSFGPNQLIKQGAKLVTSWEDVVEELPTPVRAELVPVEAASAEERTLLVEEALGPTERPIYELLTPDEARHVDEIVEKSGLTSSEVLAALFDLELRGVVRQLPGKQFLKVLL